MMRLHRCAVNHLDRSTWLLIRTGGVRLSVSMYCDVGYSSMRRRSVMTAVSMLVQLMSLAFLCRSLHINRLLTMVSLAVMGMRGCTTL